MGSAVEYIKDGDDEYTFVSNYDFLGKLEDRDFCLSTLFYRLNGGTMPLDSVCSVLECSLEELNRNKINETSKRDIVKSIIERHGLQEASMIARLMLTYMMVGSEKKSQIDKEQIVKNLTDQIIGSESMTLKKRGLLWAAHWASSVGLAWMIFNLFN